VFWEINDSLKILEEEMGVDKRKKLSWMSISVFFSTVVDFMSCQTAHSRYRLQRLVHNENNCRRVILQIWYKYQQRHIMLSPLQSNRKYPFLRMLTEGQDPLWYQLQQLD
jgi:hypothetical protein